MAEKYAKIVLGEKDIESVLDRLDRLTLGESKITIAQTLEVVRSLVNKMQAVMEGAHRQCVWVHTSYETNLVDGKASMNDIRQTLGVSSLLAQPNVTVEYCVPVLMQELVAEGRKARRP